MFKKIIAIILVLVFALLTTACGGEKKESQSTVDTSSGVSLPLKEQVTFTALACIPGANYPYESNKSIIEWCKKANVKIDFTSVLSSDLTEKRNLVINSKRYPELLFKCNVDERTQSKWGKQGILLELTDLIKNYAPNLKKILDERNLWCEIQDGEGKVYALPEITGAFQANGPLWINKKWMDNLGITKMPGSLDELYDLLVAFRTKDPNKNGKKDEIPLGIQGTSLLPAVLIYMVNSYDATTQTALDDNGNIYFVPTSDVYKKALKFVAKCFANGLCLPDAFTMDSEQVLAKGSAGDIYGCVYSGGAASVVGINNCEKYVMLHPFEGIKMQKDTGINIGTFCITDACKNPEIAMAFVDYLYSEEGSLLTRLGVEGETYTKNSDGTWDFILNKGLGNDASAIRNGHTLFGGSGNPGLTPDIWYSGMTKTTNPSDVIINSERQKLLPKLCDARPTMIYTDEQTEQSALIVADTKGLIRQYAANVIIGTKNLDNTWGEYLKSLEKMGIKNLEKIYSNAYKFAADRQKK